ncbi:hypothetical protein ppKF707_0161 [Metapseudomonas furukawaii]|uniref:Uncharacterized protein n=1 Tax=Metapseudomonas furukawaii TaxID=1149133 RepID=A0AAD1FH54_METFU|nr:hypothetical protein ppKF707_0161 [Pseudomonas furukawaii]BAU76525.1 hypothetical protein KF707C_48370 [Pseudomonas furukawaii]
MVNCLAKPLGVGLDGFCRLGGQGLGFGCERFLSDSCKADKQKEDG